MDTRQVELVASYADMLQVGSRNMQNFALLKEVGQSKKPVLLKRGMMATVEELLQAAEYILSQGNSQLILCERGIRTFETSTRNTLDLSAVLALKQRTQLPVIVDPSHGTGIRRMVPAMSKAALAVGADGLIIEVHHQPENALCDGPQSLYHEEFSVLMHDLRLISPVVGKIIKTCNPIT
jgi:3-deoxy-7-phosphoheptulonate synthase